MNAVGCVQQGLCVAVPENIFYPVIITLVFTAIFLITYYFAQWMEGPSIKLKREKRDWEE